MLHSPSSWSGEFSWSPCTSLLWWKVLNLPIYVPSLTYKVWVRTERMKLQMQAAQMSRVAQLRDRWAQTSGSGSEQCCCCSSASQWHLDVSFGRSFSHVQLEEFEQGRPRACRREYILSGLGTPHHPPGGAGGSEQRVVWPTWLKLLSPQAWSWLKRWRLSHNTLRTIVSDSRVFFIYIYLNMEGYSWPSWPLSFSSTVMLILPFSFHSYTPTMKLHKIQLGMTSLLLSILCPCTDSLCWTSTLITVTPTSNKLDCLKSLWQR